MEEKMKVEKKELPKFEDIKHEMVKVPGFENYYCHIEKALVYSTIRNKWLYQGKGTGDNSKYLASSLKSSIDGKSYPHYLHEVIYSCRNGIMKKDWRSMPIPFEIDHSNKDTKDCNPRNLQLTTSKGNKANKTIVINKNRVSMEIARQLREEVISIPYGERVEWYKKRGQELGIGGRSVQNIVLNRTYKEDIVS
ncbi:HNH endonuclease [Sutcliffiella horikoshii]|uniref:HNH endonuclease n=1 Tax=Sutcliffiella horikoshii TaxID=79883 RepID=UPI003CE7854C